MSWSSANIDLIAERNELDAFLSRCLELQPAGVDTEPREVTAGPIAAEPAGDAARGNLEAVPAVPAVNDEPAEMAAAAGHADEKAADVTADAVEVPEEKTFAAETEAPAVAAPAVEKADAPEQAPEVREQKFEAAGQVSEPAPQPETAIPAAGFRAGDEPDQREPRWADDEFTVQTPPQAVPAETGMDARQDAAPAPKAEMVEPVVQQDKSALRKPSKNAAAIAYKKKKEKKTKYVLIALYVVIALALAAEAFLYIFPNAGYRAADVIGRQLNFISGSQDVKNAGNVRTGEGRQPVNKRINQDGNNETK